MPLISKKVILIPIKWAEIRKNQTVFYFKGGKKKTVVRCFVIDKKERQLGSIYGTVFTHRKDNLYKAL